MLITGKRKEGRVFVGKEEIEPPPDGFRWDSVLNRTVLAHAVLRRVCGADYPENLVMPFVWDVVTHWPANDDWQMLVGEVKEWLTRAKRDER